MIVVYLEVAPKEFPGIPEHLIQYNAMSWAPVVYLTHVIVLFVLSYLKIVVGHK